VSPAAQTVVEIFVEAARRQASAKGVSPFAIDRWHGWNLRELVTIEEALIVAVLVDEGCKVVTLDGQSMIVLPANAAAYRLPSKAAALYLARLVLERCGEVPSNAAVRRTMAMLAITAPV